MVIAVIKVDNHFWEIKKEKGKINIVKVDDNILEKIYVDVPCLIADTKNFYIRSMIFDRNEENSTIESTGASLLETKSYYTFIEEYQDKKIAFYIKKPDVVKLFKEFAFSKIIPLDIILFRMAIKYDSEIVGIIGEKYFSYSRKISFENLETFFATDGEFNSLLFEPNANIHFFLNAITKILHIKKTIFTDAIIPEEELNKKNIYQLSLKEFQKLIENEKTFVLYDKFSDNYQSKIYRRILITLSILMVVVSPYFFYKYMEIKAKNAYYESIYKTLQEKLNNIKKIEKKYQIDYLYKVYKPFDFDKFYNDVVNIVRNSPGIISYSYAKEYFPKESPTKINLTIKGIDNFLEFQKKFKQNIVSYKISPKDDTVNVTIEIKNNKKRNHKRR